MKNFAYQILKLYTYHVYVENKYMSLTTNTNNVANNQNGALVDLRVKQYDMNRSKNAKDYIASFDGESEPSAEVA